MTHVVTGNCQGCRFTECITTCPVACFHKDNEMLYINPEECIDCAACIPVCPVQAIYSEYDLPEELKGWIEINAEKSKINPIISEQESPFPGAEERQKSLGY